MNALDDGTLLDRWRENRDGDAFAEIARRHSPVVFDITCRVLGDRSLAEDILQEALLDLALEETRKPVDVGVVAWLVRFSICRARNRRASERCRTRRQIVVGKERPEESMPDDALELKDELERALGGCDPEDRALLAMRFLHGWEYDRIASALSIQEGAARVRVHRALRNVRAKVQTTAGSENASRVAPALGALPVAAMSQKSLDASIRSVVEIAKVRLGAPANGVEHATAASRSFRVAVSLTGAALLFVAAAGATSVVDFGSPGVPQPTEVARVETVRAAVVVPGADVGDVPAPVGGAFRVAPRPAGWDHGSIGRLVRGEGVDRAAAPSLARADLLRGDAPRVDAPGGAERGPWAHEVGFDPADAFPASAGDSPSALRPNVRGACAAKGEPFSSDGERAGALGGSEAVADDDTVSPVRILVRPDVIESARASVHRRAVPLVTLDALPDATRALVDEAQGLLRDYLSSSNLVGTEATSVRRSIREVRKGFGALRRDTGRPTGAEAAAARATRAKNQAVRQVLGLLTQVVLSDGRVAGDLRWPAGADVAFALEEVIRVLGAQSQGADRGIPSGAVGPASAGGVQ
ncbi:MAG: sigma-70 family RNA polymerase sigma factor [Planctomycetes bacterium]|nr:sigma-70 family RNA polymerase sigma factor [Planctomycetota bacterium]